MADMNTASPGDIYEQDIQCTYKHSIEAHLCNRCYSGKAGIVLYSERLPVALFM